MRVDVVEYLGTESQVVGHLQLQPGATDQAADPTAGQRLSAVVPGDAKALLHKTLTLGVEPEALHVFNADSGQTLRPS
jgi:hypothetical protein